jgi:hypothetical protein
MFWKSHKIWPQEFKLLYIASNGRVISEMERIWKEAIVV